MVTLPPRSDTPGWVRAILDNRVTWWFARVAITLPYWWSGIDKGLHPKDALAEISSLLGTGTPLPFFVVLLVVQLGASLLVIFNRLAWLGAGALGVFTLVITLIAHAFWNLDGPARFAEMNTFMEHLSLIAGFVFAAMWASRAPGSTHRNHC